MTRQTRLAAAIAMAMTVTPAAYAMPIIVDGGTLEEILDDIAFDGNFNQDVNDDQHVNDGRWGISGSGGAIGVPIAPGDDEQPDFAGALRNAGQNPEANGEITFGIYGWGTPNRRVALLTTGDVIGDPALFSIKADGSVFLDNVDTGTDFNANKFGFYITDGENTWFSDFRRNANHDVHVGAYAGDGEKIQIGDNAAGFFNPGEFILAWELSPLGGFNDYADFVVLVESVGNVPEPGSMGLLGLGVAGLGWMRRRRRGA